MLWRLIFLQVAIAVAYPDISFQPWPLKLFKKTHGINCIPFIRPCPIANRTGKYLSPIDIEVEKTKFLEVPLLSFSNSHWIKKNFFIVNNTGHLAEFTQYPPMKQMTLTGGPLRSVYKLNNVHAHWNPLSDFQGSEHTFNRLRYAMEFHGVYFNKKYGSIEKAKGMPDGLAVCAFMIESVPGTHYNPQFQPISSAVDKIKEPYSAVPFRHNVYRTFQRLALSEKYYHYKGTVTGDTTEPVLWIIFKDTIHIHPDQIEPFRRMRNPQGGRILNIRDTEPLNGRSVFYIDNSNKY